MVQVDKKIVKAGIDNAMAEFTERLLNFGFNRTKKWFWVREAENSADFIHIHLDGVSYGAPINYSVSFRVHGGFRDFQDDFEALALNGPCSTNSDYRERKYHHRFNAKSGSTYKRCIDDLVKFVEEICEPWFKKQTIGVVEQKSTDSPRRQKSLKLLGAKSAKRKVT